MRRYWFRAKWYGYGEKISTFQSNSNNLKWKFFWYPSTWEGWLVLLAWFIIFVSNLMMLDHEAMKNFLFMFLDTALLIYICYKKGEKPRWRWGYAHSRNRTWKSLRKMD